MRACLLALLCLAGGAFAPRAATAGGVVEGHYVRVEGEVPTAWLETAAELGDTLFRRLEADFGRAPADADLPLELTLTPDAAALQKLIGRERIAQKEQSLGAHLGGWTRWKPCASYVALQPEAFDTRRLILHELVHQFYAKLRPVSRRGTGAVWYREGLAEWYGWHRRTREGIDFGVFDVAAGNRTLANIVARAERRAWDPFATSIGSSRVDYHDALALVAGLRGTQDKDLRARFARFEADVLARGGGEAAFAKAFAGRGEDVRRTVRSFWRTVGARAWRAHGTGWDEAPGASLARTQGLAAGGPAWLDGSWRRLTVLIELAGPEAGAGVAFEGMLAGARDLVVEVGGGRLRVVCMDGVAAAARAGRPGGAPPQELAGADLPAGDGPIRLQVTRSRFRLELVARRDEEAVRLRYEPPIRPSYDDPRLAPVLLVARSGGARFRDLQVDGRSGPLVPRAPRRK